MDKAFEKQLNQIIDSVKEDISKKNVNLIFFNEFIKPAMVCNINENIIFVQVKNFFAKQVLTKDYKEIFKNKINSALKSNYDVIFVAENDPLLPSNTKKTKENIATKSIKPQISGLNRNYTFKNFIVSNFNKTAFNAAQSIFKQKFWNPIFISGGVGLGKTHLLHAIGNEYKEIFLDKSIKYISADDFVREAYNALSISGNKVEELKEEYESIDLLLIDDIQFLEKKERINEIFFNIFNRNISNGKIIVMTSDKQPSLLKNLESRMKSRFQSGLFIEINQPDLSSLKKILEEKIKQTDESFIFSEDAINYICRRNSNDIRELEGFLHKILFYAINNNLAPNAIINIEMIKKIYENENKDNLKKYGFDVNPEIVINQVCAAYSLDPEQVKSKNRTKQISQVRQVCMYVLRNKFNMSYEQIGSFFSGRDHSTVMESIDKITKLLKNDNRLEDFIKILYKKI